MTHKEFGQKKSRHFMALQRMLLCLLLGVVLGVTGSGPARAEAQEEQTDLKENNTSGVPADETEEEGPETQDSAIRVGALSGPTAMGLVKLMEDAEEGNTRNRYAFADLMTEASASAAPLAAGELDIAAVPANLASVLYNKTDGGVRVLAVSVQSVLQIAARGDAIQTVPDLKGRILYAAGQGATPEYVLRYLLTENGLDPDADLEIRWCADTTEVLARVEKDPEAAAMLPQPFATAACAKTEGLHIVLDLGEEWDRLDNGCSIVTGVMAVRTAFAEEHPDLVDAFLEEYRASVQYTEEDPAGAAALIEKYGILGSAAIAERALPSCGIVCLTGEEEKDALSGYLQILYEQDPASVGGAMPGDDFYMNK